MDNCNYCDEINSKPLNKGMNATATWKNKHPKQKMGPSVPRVKHSSL